MFEHGPVLVICLHLGKHHAQGTTDPLGVPLCSACRQDLALLFSSKTCSPKEFMREAHVRVLRPGVQPFDGPLVVSEGREVICHRLAVGPVRALEASQDLITLLVEGRFELSVQPRPDLLQRDLGLEVGHVDVVEQLSGAALAALQGQVDQRC